MAASYTRDQVMSMTHVERMRHLSSTVRDRLRAQHLIADAMRKGVPSPQAEKLNADAIADANVLRYA